MRAAIASAITNHWYLTLRRSIVLMYSFRRSSLTVSQACWNWLKGNLVDAFGRHNITVNRSSSCFDAVVMSPRVRRSERSSKSLDVISGVFISNVKVTGAAQLYRAASVLTAGLGYLYLRNSSRARPMSLAIWRSKIGEMSRPL